jgi:DNA-binding response OmpR family regulator
MLVDDEPDIALAFKIGLWDNGFAVDALDDPTVAFWGLNVIFMIYC